MSIAPAAFAADLENGAQVFAGNCAACHAGGNNVIQNEKVILSSSVNSMRICQLSVYRITLTCQRILSNMPPIFFVVTDPTQRGPWGLPCWRPKRGFHRLPGKYQCINMNNHAGQSGIMSAEFVTIYKIEIPLLLHREVFIAVGSDSPANSCQLIWRKHSYISLFVWLPFIII